MANVNGSRRKDLQRSLWLRSLVVVLAVLVAVIFSLSQRGDRVVEAGTNTLSGARPQSLRLNDVPNSSGRRPGAYLAGSENFFSVKDTGISDLLSPSACGWASAPVYPINISSSAVVTIGANIYVFGGFSTSANVATSYKFNGTTWTQIQSLPTARSGAVAVTDGTFAYIINGNTSSGNTASLVRYDPAANTYNSVLTQPTTPTVGSAAAFLNGKIYRIAGEITAGAPTKTVEAYTIATNSWANAAIYPDAVNFLNAVAINGKVYAAGGLDSSTNTRSIKTYAYDPVANTWTDAGIADLPTTLAPRWGSASGLFGGNWVLATGVMDSAPIPYAIQWNPTTNLWTSLPNAITAQYRTGGATLNNTFYAIGGGAGSTDNQALTCAPDTPGTLQFNFFSTTVFEGNFTYQASVTRTGGTFGPVSVQYQVIPGSATAGSDYTVPQGQPLNWPDGDASTRIISFQIFDDGLNEDDESFNIQLVNPNGGATLGFPSNHTVTIYDNEPKGTFSVGNLNQSEGNGPGTTQFNVPVTLTRTGPGTVYTSYSTSNGTASAPGDYTAANSIFVFGQNQTSGTIPISVVGDNTTEPDETFFVTPATYAPNPNVTVGTTGVETIFNDDCPTTGSLNYGQSFTGIFSGSSCGLGGNKADVYTFQGTAGIQVVITMTSDEFVTGLELVNPSGILVQQASGSGGLRNSRLPSTGSYTLLQNGTYTIRAKSLTGFGAYTLSLNQIPPSGCFYNLSPTSTSAPFTGGTFYFDVLTDPGCPPAIFPQSSGSIYNNLSYSGGRVTFTVQPNNSSGSVGDTISFGGGTISEGGQAHTIFQFGTASLPNDFFGNATLISGTNGQLSSVQHNTNASSEPGEKAHAGNTATRSVWYRWTAPADGFYTFSTFGSPFDTVLAVYQSATLPTSSTPEIASSDNTTEFDKTSRVNFLAAANQEYKIVVDGVEGANGTVQLSWRNYRRLFRFYTKNANGDASPREPLVRATRLGGNNQTFDAVKVGLGVQELDLEPDNFDYRINITSAGIAWSGDGTIIHNIVNLPRPLSPLDTVDTTISTTPTNSNSVTGLISNLGSTSGLTVKVSYAAIPGVTAAPLPQIPQVCSTILEGQYVRYTCPFAPDSYHTVIPSKLNTAFNLSERSFTSPVTGPTSLGPSDVINASPSTTYSISGRILTSGGQGIANAVVYLSSGARSDIVNAGADGSYQFTNLPGPRNYVISASQGSFLIPSRNVNNLQSQATGIDLTAEGCTYVVTGSTQIGQAGGQNFVLGLTASNRACGWKATNLDATWLTISSGTGIGNGQIQFVVQANSGPPRTGTIKVGVQNITVQQSGIPADVSVAATTPNVLEDSGGPLAYTFTRTGAPVGTLTVNFQASGSGTACRVAPCADTFPVDYNVSGASFNAATGVGSVVIPDGSPSVALQVTPVADTRTEPDETVILATTPGGNYNPVGGPATGNILNDDSDVSAVVSPTPVNENSGTPLVYTFTRNGMTGANSGLKTINISVAGTACGASVCAAGTTDVTASSPAGSQPLTFNGTNGTGTGSGTVTFAAGVNTAVVNITPIADNNVEQNETVILGVTATPGINIGSPATATGTIADEDSNVSVSVAPAAVSENGGIPLVYTFSRSGLGSAATTGSLTINFSITGTACGAVVCAAGTTDLTASSPPASQPASFNGTNGTGTGTGTVTFAASATTAVVNVTPIADQTVENNETLIVTVTSGANYTPSGTATGIINDANSTVKHVRSDFDGDGKSDIGVFRESEGNWYFLNSLGNTFGGVHFGIVGDRIVPGDYDGDGKTDFAVWRPSSGTWFILNSTGGFIGVPFGLSTDLPAQGDYDNDGKTDIAVWRPSNGTWFLQQSTAGFAAVQFGANGDRPVPGDYDGDGKTDVAVFRPSEGNWYLLQSTAGFGGIHFGIPTDKVVPADFDGDGKTDVAVFRVDGTGQGVWFLLQSTAGFAVIPFGTTNDIPAPGDFDGDSKADTTVFRPSNGIWFSQQTTSGFVATQFGQNGDKPVPVGYVPVQ